MSVQNVFNNQRNKAYDENEETIYTHNTSDIIEVEDSDKERTEEIRQPECTSTQLTLPRPEPPSQNVAARPQTTQRYPSRSIQQSQTTQRRSIQ